MLVHIPTCDNAHFSEYSLAHAAYARYLLERIQNLIRLESAFLKCQRTTANLANWQILNENYDSYRVPCKLELTIWFIPVRADLKRNQERHFQLSPRVKPMLELQKSITLTLASLLLGAIPALQVS